MVATPILKAAIKSTKVSQSHGNNVCDVIIVHMQTNRHGKQYDDPNLVSLAFTIPAAVPTSYYILNVFIART